MQIFYPITQEVLPLERKIKMYLRKYALPLFLIASVRSNRSNICYYIIDQIERKFYLFTKILKYVIKKSKVTFWGSG